MMIVRIVRCTHDSTLLPEIQLGSKEIIIQNNKQTRIEIHRLTKPNSTAHSSTLSQTYVTISRLEDINSVMEHNNSEGSI